MADNTTLNVGSGGDTYRSKDRAGVKTPVSLLDFGTSSESLVSAGNPLPVTLGGASVAITAAALPLPSGASTEATLAGLSAKVTTCNTGAVVLTTSSAVIGHVVVDSGTITLSTGVVLGASSALIGHVVVDGGAVAATQLGTWTVGLNAGTALVGQVAGAHQVDVAYSGTTVLTPKFAAISASSSGSNTLVAAVTSKRIRVLGYAIQAAGGAVSVKFQSAGSTDLTGLFALVANQVIPGGDRRHGHFQTVAGEALTLNLSAAVQVSGYLTYVEV